MSLDIEALKRLNAAVLAAVEEREELRRQARAHQERVEHLEAALRQITSCEPHAPGDVVHVARAALGEGRPPLPVLDPQEAWVLYREGGRCDGLG